VHLPAPAVTLQEESLLLVLVSIVYSTTPRWSPTSYFRIAP
jgi:hypothetical protein